LIQDEATTISRIADATTAATSYRARTTTTTTTTTVHSATNGKTSHTTTDHQSAERSVIIEKSRNDILEQQLIEYEEFKQEVQKKFILTNSRFIAY